MKCPYCEFVTDDSDNKYKAGNYPSAQMRKHFDEKHPEKLGEQNVW